MSEQDKLSLPFLFVWVDQSPIAYSENQSGSLAGVSRKAAPPTAGKTEQRHVSALQKQSITQKFERKATRKVQVRRLGRRRATRTRQESRDG